MGLFLPHKWQTSEHLTDCGAWHGGSTSVHHLLYPPFQGPTNMIHLRDSDNVIEIWSELKLLKLKIPLIVYGLVHPDYGPVHDLRPNDASEDPFRQKWARSP